MSGIVFLPLSRCSKRRGKFDKKVLSCDPYWAVQISACYCTTGKTPSSIKYYRVPRLQPGEGSIGGGIIEPTTPAQRKNRIVGRVFIPSSTNQMPIWAF